MNDTFEDRLWSVLIDEVRAPSLPSFDEPSPLGRPRPVRRRTPLLLAGGIAAAAALRVASPCRGCTDLDFRAIPKGEDVVIFVGLMTRGIEREADFRKGPRYPCRS